MADNANEKMYELMAKHLTYKDVRWASFTAKIKALFFKCKMLLRKKDGDGMATNKKIKEALHVGDEVFSNTGESMKILRIDENGVTTEQGFLPFSEHRKTWFLTKIGRALNKSKDCDRCFHVNVCGLDVCGECPHLVDTASAVVEATKIKEAKLEIANRMDAFISGWLNISADTVNYWGGKVEAMTIAKSLVSSILTDLIDGTPKERDLR